MFLGKQSYFVLVFLCFLAQITVACGSRLPLEGAVRGSARGGTNGSPGEGAADATASGRCPIEPVPPELAAKGFQSHHLANFTLLTADGYRKNLCDTLKDSENGVLIMQFSGVTCGSCQEEAAFFTSALNLSSKYGNPIGHAVAITDFPEDYVEEDYASFMMRLAPRSLRVHDVNIQLWSAFSADSSAPARPTIIAYNQKGWTYVLNRDRGGPAANGQSILAAAEVLAAIRDADGIAAEPNDQNDQNDQLDGSKDPADPSVEPVPVNPIFPAPSGEPAPAPSTNPDPAPTIGPIPLPTVTPTPAKPAVQIAANKNFGLSGGKPSETLASYFEDNEYLIVDISQVNCSPCVRMAQGQNSDAGFKEEMTGGKCKNLTVVSDRELSGWLQKFPANTFVGGRSRGVSSITSFGSAWGFGSLATPTVFVIDRSGAKVASAVGSEPSEVERLCKK